MTPAWTVGAWPPVLWQPDQHSSLHFVHLGTHVSARHDPTWPNMGQTVWGGRAGDSAAGVSWDWIEVAEGIVAIADPMMMISNLRLLGPDGEVLTAHEVAPYLNEIVHRLPWQSEVHRAIDANRPAIDDGQYAQGEALRGNPASRAGRWQSSGFGSLS